MAIKFFFLNLHVKKKKKLRKMYKPLKIVFRNTCYRYIIYTNPRLASNSFGEQTSLPSALLVCSQH